eukprot:15317-Pelagococcus_subviridis.AAC.1
MSDMQMSTIAPEVEKETAGPVCEATMTQQPVMQQPQVIMMGDSNTRPLRSAASRPSARCGL